LRFGDCDQSGTAYYPAYLKLLDSVVEEFWSDLGWPWHHTIPTDGWGTPTVHLTCDFARASRMGDTLTFRLTVLKIGRSSLRLAHSIHCGDDLRWTAEQVLAACRISTYEAMPWPPEVRAKLESFL
jgi:4-hydroxybenzoyl-CoA thioesterase